jgi:glycine dehydrogenase
MSAPFSTRHIGLSPREQRSMLATLGVTSVDTLISQAVPKSIRLDRPLDLPEPGSEAEALSEMAAIMAKNEVLKSFIGAGYHGVHVPPVIQRNMFENPAWYTAYTPYQSEISQGRLEMLFHFQTLVAELTGLPVASASLLDEATAVAEAIGIAHRFHKDSRDRVAVAGNLHPHVLDVVKTRAEPIGIIVEQGEPDSDTAALIVPWPDTYGVYGDHAAAIAKAKADGAIVIFVADPLGLVLTEPPAALGAEIVVGSMQRFGLLRRVGPPDAANAWPARRSIGRRAWPPRLPAGAANPRTAYPSRQGDLQHLHRAGPARQYGRSLCDLARTGGPAGDRPTRARPCSAFRGGAG